MLKLRTIIVLAALAACLVAPSAAQGASGQIGNYWGVQVTCDGNRIIVTGPSMTPAYDILWTSNGGMILNPSQQVAYRAHVAKLVNGSWVRVASGSWLSKWVTEAGGGGMDSTWFTVTQAGRYKVYAEYYWYANQYFPYSGYDLQWAQFTADFNARGYMGWGDPYCG